MEKIAAIVACLLGLFSCVALAGEPSSEPAGLGSGKFGQPETINLILAVSKKWKEAGEFPFGVGDVSAAAGSALKTHASTGDHATGWAIDIRPLRKDGQNLGVTWEDTAYDREATQRLVSAFKETGQVERIVFNDPNIKGVQPYPGCDDHLHIMVKKPE